MGTSRRVSIERITGAGRRVLWLALGAGLVVSPLARALNQLTTGASRGNVKHANGKPLSYVQVAARDVERNVTRGTLTNPEGFYNLAGLRPGPYDMTVRRIGSSPQTRRVVVQVGAIQMQDFSLVGQAAQL